MANVSINSGFDFFDRHTKTIERAKTLTNTEHQGILYRLVIPFSYLTPKEYEDLPGTPTTDPDFGEVITKHWNWDLSDWTERMVEAHVSYDPSGGASAQITVSGRRLMGYEGFPVILIAGYENPDAGGVIPPLGSDAFYDEFQPIFQGHIYDIDDRPDNTTQISCYANAKIRGDQVLGVYADYRDLTLADAMYDVMIRSGRFYGYLMRGGFDFVIHNPETDDRTQPGLGEFQFETTLAEVQNTLVEPAGYVRYDCPFGEVIQARPVLKSNEATVTNLHEADYDAGGFTFTPGQRGYYEKVVVFRRKQDADQTTGDEFLPLPGEQAKMYAEQYEVYADRDVDNGDRFEAPAGRWYVVADFNGTQEEAQVEANRLAQYLSETGGEFELQMDLADFWLYDSFAIYRTEMPLPTNTAYLYGVPVPLASGWKRLLAQYRCLVESGIEFSISSTEYKVRLRGSAILQNIAGIDSLAETTYRSTGLVPLPGDMDSHPPVGTSPPPPPPPTSAITLARADITLDRADITLATLVG